MSELNINGKVHQVSTPQVFPKGKHAPGSDEARAALWPIEEDPKALVTDGLLLTDSKNEYVVRKQGLNPKLKEGDKVTLDGKPMTVVASNDAADTFPKRQLQLASFGLIAVVQKVFLAWYKRQPDQDPLMMGK